MESSAIPVIDLRPAIGGTAAQRRLVAREIDAACRALGFLIVAGHGVPDAVVAQARAAALQFFALPEDIKTRARMQPGAYRGYVPYAKETLSASLDNPSPPDLKELFNFGPLAAGHDEYFLHPDGAGFFVPNIWPAAPANFRPAMEAYYRAMETLATDLMRLFALGLELPEDYFDDKVNRHITNLSVLHYPALSEPPLAGQLRAGAHSDYGSLTILQREETAGGLEVMSEGRWIAVPNIPGAFVVNLGDLMQDWTGGAWHSTLHRVVNPPGLGTAARLSMAFFHQPNWDAMISPLPVVGATQTGFQPVNSGAHVMAKIAKQTGATKMGADAL
jgi:isopenicillin N synthase-like dioxygenase